MRTLRQRIIEQEIKQGKSFLFDKPEEYIEAIFMVKEKSKVDKKDVSAPSQELSKLYTFKIKKDKFGQFIEKIKSMPGVTVQTKNE